MDTKDTLPALPDAGLLEAPDVGDLLDGLSPMQMKALESLARGDTMSKASQVAGISRRTIYDWIHQPTEFARAYDQWKRLMAETSRTRLLMIGEAATVQIAKAIGAGDTRAALAVAKGMGLLSPPPVGPSLTQTRAQIEEAKTPIAAKAREFQDLISGLTDSTSMENYHDDSNEDLDKDEFDDEAHDETNDAEAGDTDSLATDVEGAGPRS